MGNGGKVDWLYNNAKRYIYVKSVDPHNNGKIAGTDGTFRSNGELTTTEWVGADPGAHRCESFGIPWYGQGKKWKIFTFDPKSMTGVKVYQAGMNGKNYIYYENWKTGQTLIKQEVPLEEDYRCKLFVTSEEAIRFEVVSTHKQAVPFETLIWNGLVWVEHQREDAVEAMVPILVAAMTAAA